MKAVVYGGVGHFHLQDVPEPKLEQGGLLGRVECCGICGTDYKLFHNANPRFPPGSILGHEFVAEVIEASEGAEGFAVGDRVTMATTVPCGEGSFCQRSGNTGSAGAREAIRASETVRCLGVTPTSPSTARSMSPDSPARAAAARRIQACSCGLVWSAWA